MAGKPAHAHQMALLDVFRGTNARARTRLDSVVICSEPFSVAYGLDWLEGMGEENHVEFGKALEGEDVERLLDHELVTEIRGGHGAVAAVQIDPALLTAVQDAARAAKAVAIVTAGVIVPGVRSAAIFSIACTCRHGAS